MGDYEVLRIPHGWTVKNGVADFDIHSPHLDRGQIRGVLTIRQGVDDGVVILYRNTVNLTSERSRQKVVRTLADKHVTVDENLLIALEDACHRPPPSAQENVYRGGGNESETVPHTLAELEAVFQQHLLLVDRALLPVLTGAILAHRLDGEQVWLLIVAPPGGTKTEPLRSLYGARGMYPLSKLTPRTFASGLDVPGNDPSLLARLKDEVLIVKDLTTVLEMQGDDRSEIFAQLREIYDGRFDMVWGTGKELHWEGRLGFIAGVTPIIDRHHSALAVLGERFVMLRLAMPNRRNLALRALAGAGREVAMREALDAAMRGFLASRGSVAPQVSQDVTEMLATVADFVTRARSGVIRDGFRRELEYAPEPEAPTRFAKVLRGLACGIALAHDRGDVTTEDLGYVLRVALDSLPDVRRRVIKALVEQTVVDAGAGELATSTIVGMTQFSSATIRRTLEDLQALRVVHVEKHGPGKADTWTIDEEWRDVFTELGDAALRTIVADDEAETVSENLDPPSYTQEETPTPGAPGYCPDCGEPQPYAQTDRCVRCCLKAAREGVGV
ncbi:MAG: hypothetical protein ACJ8F2_01245 [Xanthobacteraceae bacterium]